MLCWEINCGASATLNLIKCIADKRSSMCYGTGTYAFNRPFSNVVLQSPCAFYFTKPSIKTFWRVFSSYELCLCVCGEGMCLMLTLYTGSPFYIRCLNTVNILRHEWIYLHIHTHINGWIGSFQLFNRKSEAWKKNIIRTCTLYFERRTMKINMSFNSKQIKAQ